MGWNEVVANVEGSYAEKAKRNLGNSAEFYSNEFPQEFHWAWGPVGDGSFFAVMTDRGGRLRDNKQYFPTAWEAQRYAQHRAAGSLDVGALMRLMQERTENARTAHSQAPVG